MFTLQETVPLVSVAICTCNRPDMIGQAVASVLASNYPTFDLTVIDQSISDKTEAVLRPTIVADPRLHYVRVDEPGLSRARNTAISHMTGQILAFTDDDCRVPHNWLNTIVQAFADDDEAVLLYGTVLPPHPDSIPAGGAPALEIRQPQRLSRRDGFKVYGMGANFAARRCLFATIGGFDEVLGAGGPLCAAEDFDLSYRAYLAGAIILLRPEVQVVHYGRRSLTEWPALLRNYGIGDGAFFSKHVRCRDLFALWLLSSRIIDQFARAIARKVVRGHALDLTYVRSILVGIRHGYRFEVDCHSRLYVRR